MPFLQPSSQPKAYYEGTAHFCTLNDDVLATIVSFLKPRDALSLSLTTRAVHDIAQEHAVACVAIKHHSQIPPMILFFLHDSVRPHLLRELDVRCDFKTLPRVFAPKDYSAASPLAKLLEQASNLRVLRLSWAEQLLKQDSRIGNAIAALPRLDELDLSGIEHRCIDVLRRLRSTPRRPALREISYEIGCVSVLEGFAALQGLINLTFLYATWLVPEVPANAISRSPRWPSVKEVLSHGIPWPLLVHAFPHAQHRQECAF